MSLGKYDNVDWNKPPCRREIWSWWFNWPSYRECISKDAAVEELKSFFVNKEDATKVVKVGKDLVEPMKKLLKDLKAKLDVFVLKHFDMVEIDLKVICHSLKINFKAKPEMRKRC